jgi:hypothetical protein
MQGSLQFQRAAKGYHKALVEKKLGRIVVQGAANVALPDFDRKQAHVRLPCQERRSRVYGRYFRADEINRRDRRSRERFSICNESTVSRQSSQQAFHLQLFVSGRYDAATDPPLGCKIPMAWKAIANF